MLRRGCHCVIATPGRLKDMLHKKRMTMDQCRILCLDEADRMVDQVGCSKQHRRFFRIWKKGRVGSGWND